MDVAIVGDSHVPTRETQIPDAFRDRIAAADHVIHTGDFTSEDALDEFRELSTDFTAVAGNMDRRLGLPSVTAVSLGGVEFVVTHGTGSPSGWAERVAETVGDRSTDEPAVGVGGHTHRAVDRTHEGVRLLNPGSVTGAVPAERPTMITAEATDGDLRVSVHEL